MVEGIHGIQDILRAGIIPLYVVCTSSELLPEELDCKVFISGPKAFEHMSATEQPQGILAVVPFLKTKPLGQKILVLDAVSDPGNVGTIIRTAAWFGATDVVLSAECADIYNPKVVRATTGAFAAINVLRKQDISTMEFPEGAVVTGLDAHRGIAASELRNTTGYCLVIGSEAHGISELMQARCTQFVHISSGASGLERGSGTESLNAAIATAICLYETTQ